MNEENCFNCKFNWRKDALSNDCNEYAELLSVFKSDLKQVFTYEETRTAHGPLFVCSSCNVSFLKLRDAKTNFLDRTSRSSKVALLQGRSEHIFVNENDQCLQSGNNGILNKNHSDRDENDLLQEIEAILPDKEANNDSEQFGIDNAANSLPTDSKIVEFQEKYLKLQLKKLLLTEGNRLLLNTERKKTQQISRSDKNKEAQELISCDKCGRNFQELQLLQDHYNSAHFDSIEHKFSCQFCPSQFSLQWFLKNHVQSRHNGIEILHSCRVCFKTFHNEEEMKDHVLKKHDVREHPFKCVNCVDSFSIIQDLRSHLLQHHKESKQAEAAGSNIKLLSKQCNYCSESFSTINELREHIKLAHDKPNFECEICKKWFISHSKMICHRKTHLSCNSCHKTFQTFCGLKTHIENVHPVDENRPYCCEICGQRYFSSNKLLAHYSWHCSVNGPKHFCNACNKSFKLRHQLSHHIEKCHTRTLSKYKCEHCEEEFKVKYNLHVHMETVHEAKCDFACKTCGKRFLTVKSVSCHNRIHTMATKFKPGYDKTRQAFTDDPGVVDKIEVTSCFSPDAMLFTCAICSKSCETQTHFIRHLRLLHNVTGFKDPNIKLESNIKCPQCDKCFSRKDLVKKHQRKKHMNKSAVFISNEYECPCCSRILKCAFKDFVAHIKRHEVFISSVNKKTKAKTEKELSEFYNEQDNTYTCFDCNTKSQRQSYFFKHLNLKCKGHLNEFKVIFRDEKESKAKFQFQCPKCPRSYPSSSLLKKHMEFHGRKSR